MEAKFNLDRLVNDVNSGIVKSAEVTIDPAHAGKPEHIDAHIFYHDRTATKLTNLCGISDLQQACPWMQPGSTLKL